MGPEQLWECVHVRVHVCVRLDKDGAGAAAERGQCENQACSCRKAGVEVTGDNPHAFAGALSSAVAGGAHLKPPGVLVQTQRGHLQSSRVKGIDDSRHSFTSLHDSWPVACC